MAEIAYVDPETCIGCGVCVDSCAPQALEMLEDKAKVDASKCNGCKTCIDTCPVQAISMKQ